MTDALTLIVKHRKTGALFDANLLLVYAVGMYDKGRLPHYSHTKQYVYDFDLIKALVKFFPVIYTTPNILTEIGNLGGKLGPAFFSILKTVVQFSDEQYCASKDAVSEASFHKLGLTDAGIIGLAANKYVVITADWPLYQILRFKGIDAVNINHLRPLDWLSQISS
jgi:hypothetical protein